MSKKPKIHLVDDEYIIHDIIKRLFNPNEYELIISENKHTALENHTPDVDVVIMDLMIPGTSGIEIFKELKKNDPEIKAIFLTAFGTIDTAIETIKLGALDYLQKPFNNLDLKHRINRIIKEKSIAIENINLKKVLNQRFNFGNIIGISKALKKTLSTVESVAKSNSTILITGESGTGKELIAKAIFLNSNRAKMPFISFNSSNIPETLFESMLFGHKKGAFTGAYTDKKGAFEAADKGTIFFDEISNISTEIQAKILRVLQEKEIQPLGSNKAFKVDVRIIAATNVDLRERIKTNEFREDLFFRLNVIDIKLPSLRERKEDIPLLVSHFLEKYNKENDKNLNIIPKIFMKYMIDYNWPGNIRELENAINRVVLLSSKNELDYKTLPYEITNFDPEFDTNNNHNNDFNTQIELYKKKLIIRALNECNWIQKKAALSLGLKATTLSELMKRLEITK